ncbi:MAG: hypothetical protein OSA51_07965 [Octadecabacter sp.]|nr:hypothetical protein [Octadecabacter sp.]
MSETFDIVRSLDLTIDPFMNPIEKLPIQLPFALATLAVFLNITWDDRFVFLTCTIHMIPLQLTRSSSIFFERW